MHTYGSFVYLLKTLWTKITLIASVCDAGSYFDRNFSG